MAKGEIISFYTGVARIGGFKDTFVHELVVDDEGKTIGLVTGFDRKETEVLFWGKIDINKPVFQSEKSLKIKVGENYIGRVVDGLGSPIDGLGEILGEETIVFAEAPPIIDRQPVTQPLTTGIKLIDLSLPLGKGQRELIIGDRKLGKSTLAMDIILNQKEVIPKVKCVYVLCGQKEQKLEEMINFFNENGLFLYSTIIVASASESLAKQYLAPFVGCRIAEYFRDKGEDAIVVYDDLSQHAKTYRSMSLLLKRPPGREAYPGDIFSLHAGLLERAAKLSKEKGGGSLTALPIVETEAGDITSFVATNVISITDGQFYLEDGLFQKGFLPAINVGLSVSRIGSQAQPPVLKEVVRSLRLVLAQYKELQKLSQLESMVSEESQKKIKRGDLLLELLKQKKHTKVSWMAQTVLFWIIDQGLVDEIPLIEWTEMENLYLNFIKSRYPGILEQISKGVMDDKVKEMIIKSVEDYRENLS